MSLFEELFRNTEKSEFFEHSRPEDQPNVDSIIRLIAFYLPQFHPVAENNEWWGKGFTEWTNVTRAIPRFAGHYQPHLPADLGFYDLRISDNLRQQAELARRYGVSGFCLHHYWFQGRRLLEQPLNILLENPDIDIGFCLNWANESWTRIWTGHKAQTLLRQEHSPEDDIAFIESLKPALDDRRYIHVGDRPLLMIYRPEMFADAKATTERWREHMVRSGRKEPFLVMVQQGDVLDPRAYGMDAAVEFPPHKLGFSLPRRKDPVRLYDPGFRGTIVEYDSMVANAIATPKPDYPVIRGVCPSFDNESRHAGRGFTFRGATPAKYGYWLEQICRDTIAAEPPERQIVFINAWNEWAEGAHLEPDRHYGHAYLAETGRALERAIQPKTDRFDACFPRERSSAIGNFGIRVRNKLMKLSAGRRAASARAAVPKG